MASASDPNGGGATRRRFLAATAALAALPAHAIAGVRTTSRLLDAGRAGALRVDLAVPDEPAPEGGMPLLVVLDGNAWFPVAASIAAARAEEIGPLAIMGVGYPGEAAFDPRRLKDLTPWPPQTPLDGPQAAAPVGGADLLADALIERLMPFAVEQAPIARGRRGLFGHSLGGLFTLHMLFTRPGIFDFHAAASPSIWWNRARVLAEAKAARWPAPGPRVLLTAGGLEDELSPADIAWYRRSLSADPDAYGGRALEAVIAEARAKVVSNRMTGEARDMAGRLRTRGLDAAYVEFAGETHNSSAPLALNRALSLLTARAA